MNHRVVHDLSQAADELRVLAVLANQVEQTGVADERAINQARVRSAMALAAAAESMSDAGMQMSKTIGRLGSCVLGGFRGASQLEGDVSWCRQLAAAVADCDIVETRAA